MSAPTPTLEETIARMKREIIDDTEAGIMPANCPDFCHLHDHVDANYYGGFLEDALLDPLIAHYGGLDANGAFPDALMAYVNAAQHAVDQWLKAGGLLQSVRKGFVPISSPAL